MSEQPSERLKRLVTLARALPPAHEYSAEADAACAQEAAVARQEDVCANAAYVVGGADPLLSILLCRKAPLTLAALAARGDVDIYRFDTAGFSAVATAVAYGASQLKALLDAFPMFDVNAPCHRSGITPLADVIRSLHSLRFVLGDNSLLTCVQMLLDAGAEFSRGVWGDDDAPPWFVAAAAAGSQHECASLCVDTIGPQLAAMVAPHILWAFRLRREWTLACVALASGAAEPLPLPRSGLLLHVFADTLRVCIAPGLDQGSHQLLSEYAGLVAAFL